MFGAVELGGTKIICGVGHDHTQVLETVRFDTTSPSENLAAMIEFWQDCESRHGTLRGLGVAAFGPVDIDPQSKTYGQLLDTPKPGWSQIPIREQLEQAFAARVAVTTDVNAALLAESRIGAARGVRDAVYVTIGTGVGAGIMVEGRLVAGFMHPETGHMRIPTAGVAGICPFHGNCVEGLVSGPAIAARAGQPAHKLAEDHPVWAEVAVNIADMCINLVSTLMTRRVILGGGVMSKAGLLDEVRRQFMQRMGDYLPIDGRAGGVEQLIVSPGLPGDSGLLGAFMLAAD